MKEDEYWATIFDESRPHGEWTPCSERLPEESGTYLVTLSTRDRNAVVISYFLKKCSEWEHDEDEVVAWMPLPEPYKGGENDEK